MNTHANGSHTITLDDQEWAHLLLALGTATIAARKGLCVLTFPQVLRLVNTINKDNPDFIPYEVPDE